MPRICPAVGVQDVRTLMPINVVAKRQITVGTEEFVEGAAPDGSFVVIFEDDGDTGYFYALDRSQSGQPIRDAMHIL